MGNEHSSADSLRRDALVRSLQGRLEACNLDEARVIDAIVAGLEIGRQKYGELDLSKRHNWAREEAEEHRDAVVYRACRMISRQDEQRRQLREDAHAELVQAGLVELRESAAVDSRPVVDLSFDMFDESEGT